MPLSKRLLVLIKRHGSVKKCEKETSLLQQATQGRNVPPLKATTGVVTALKPSMGVNWRNRISLPLSLKVDSHHDNNEEYTARAHWPVPSISAMEERVLKLVERRTF
jgi:hypothetical protein